MVPDPISAIVFTAFFAGVTLAAIQRPIYGLCALIAAQPFAFYQVLPHTDVTLSKTALAALLLALAVSPGSFGALRSARARPLLVAGIALCAATMLTLPIAAYHNPVIRETLKALEYVLIFCAALCAYRADPDRALVRTTIFATVAAVCALALAQEIVGAPSALLMNGHPVPRIAGPLEGPNQLAGFFDIALPLVFAFAVDEPAAAAYVLLAAIVCTDLLTFSRGGALGATTGIAIVALMRRRNLLPGFAAMFAGLIAGAGVASVWGGVAHAIGLSRFWDFSETRKAGGVGRRSVLWHAALTLWERHPLLGVGAGNFERELPSAGLRGVRTHANNLYLQSLAEGGIPLLAATLGTIYAAIATFARRTARSPLALAALAATFALAIHQCVDLLVFYPKIGGTWWLLLGIGAAEL